MNTLYNTIKTYWDFAYAVILLMVAMASANAQVNCSGLPVWSASSVYTGGSQVQHNNVAYKANWWTQNENPATNSGQWQVWTNLGSCGSGGGNTPPSGSITSPASGSTFTAGANITIQATASDPDGSVANVAFRQNGNVLGQDSSSPYSFTWNSVPQGSYSLTIVVTDNQGATTTSAGITITVNASQGGGGSCSGTPQYTENGGYTAGSQVQNGGNKYQCKEYPYSGWCNGSAWAYAPGTGSYWQDAWTLVGACGSGGGGGNTPPSVSITAPSNGSSFQPGSTIAITANASDADGTVSKVAFYQNGTLLGEDTSAPYNYNWTNVSSGNYTLTAVATDNNNATTTSAQVSTTVSSGGGGGTGTLPDRLLVGYWHNFDNGSGVVKLRDVSDKWDVINIAFAEPTVQGGASMTFTPDNAIYSSIQEFKNDVALVQSRGKKVLISIGGANGTIHLENASHAQSFSSTMVNIINEYGFDGLDIDLEGSSLSLVGGDTDFRFPTSPRIVHFINGMNSILSNYGSDFILTAAPETAYVQGGYSTYGGVYGAYLPVLYALKDRMAYIHVQHYNTGCMLGLDNRCYSQGTADFHVAMGEMLLRGFSVAGNPTSFPAFRQDQVAIGLPASPSAAGGGYTSPANVKKALDYLIKGVPYGGTYTLIAPGGYPDFRGLMTWSINWDINFGYEFSNNYRAYLDALPASRWIAVDFNDESPIEEELTIGPNPFREEVQVRLAVAETKNLTLSLYNQSGQRIAVLREGLVEKGLHSMILNTSELKPGMFFLRLTTDTEMKTIKLIRE